MSLQRTVRAAVLSILALALLGCGQSAAPQAAAPPASSTPAAAGSKPAAPPALTTVRYAQVANSAQNWPTYVGRDKGFFTQQGINLDLLISSASSEVMAGLQGGSLDVAHASADVPIAADLKGANMVIVGGVVNRPPYSVVVRKGVDDFAGLKGQTIAVTQVKGDDALILQEYLAKHGVEPGSYSLVAGGGNDKRYAALLKGAYGASDLTQPFDLMAQDQGMKVLGSTLEVGDVAFTSIYVRRDWAASHKDLLVRYLKAYSQAAKWLADPANRQEASEILAKQTKSDVKYALATWDMYHQYGALTTDGSPTIPGLEKILQLMKEEGIITGAVPSVNQFLDLSYLQAALKS